MILTILNLIAPGAGLFWKRQTLQGCLYMLCFGWLSGWRAEIGAMWALYVLALAQVHFHKVKNLGNVRRVGKKGKTLAWIILGSLVLLYSFVYGPAWARGGRIVRPVLLYVSVLVSLSLPTLVLIYWLGSRGQQAEEETA